MRYKEIVRSSNEVLSQYQVRLTIRQLYYRLVSPPYRLFANTQTNYKKFDKIMTKAREKLDIDWSRIEDRARTILGGEGRLFNTPGDYVDWLFFWINAEQYDHPLWRYQPTYVEVWVEKDALSSLFQAAARPFRTVVFPSRGYSSLTKVMEAVKRFPASKETVILHFADHDPSGVDMTRDIWTRVLRYGARTCRVKRMALTINQVKEFALPPNPTKRADARSANYIATYGDACWELDAVPPDRLQEIVGDAIRSELDMDVWNRTTRQTLEDKERIAEVLRAHKSDLSALHDQIMRDLDYFPE
jgi:hypothetical protein